MNQTPRVRRALHPYVPPLLIAALAALLYGAFLNNPLIFDDLYFFVPGNPEHYVSQGLQIRPRWLATYSHGLTFVLFGDEIIWQRLGNLILHACTGIALYSLIRRLLEDLGAEVRSKTRAKHAALVAAVLFVAHPAAVYASGYLIQRTTVMAAFFCLLSWLSFWRGLEGRRGWLWLSAAFYALAMLSKEHAVMAPAVAMLLLAVRRQSGLAVVPGRLELALLGTVFAAIAGYSTLAVKRVLGAAYEPTATAALNALSGSGPSSEPSHFLSIVTQAGLFFKYLLLWLLPDGMQMSVDIREPFIQHPIPTTAWLFLLAFIAYPTASLVLLSRGKITGLVGVALLSPWLMFMTELSTVRIQEIFVIYRSYLWAPPLFILLAIVATRLPSRQTTGIASLIVSLLCLLTFDRLTSFKDPFFLWNDSIRILEGKASPEKLHGAERMYHNRGIALYSHGMIQNAIEDYTKALTLNPSYANAYSDRGAAYLDLTRHEEALADFDSALLIDRNLVRALAGRALALERKGALDEATKAHAVACEAGWTISCNRESSPSK